MVLPNSLQRNEHLILYIKPLQFWPGSLPTEFRWELCSNACSDLQHDSRLQALLQCAQRRITQLHRFVTYDQQRDTVLGR